MALCGVFRAISMTNCNIMRMYVNMGVQLQRAGRSLEAVDAYVKSISIKPFVEAWHNLAGVCVHHVECHVSHDTRYVT